VLICSGTGGAGVFCGGADSSGFGAVTACRGLGTGSLFNSLFLITGDEGTDPEDFFDLADDGLDGSCCIIFHKL